MSHASPATDVQNTQLSDWEFIALTAFMMSLMAMAIDMMLPALPLIGADLGVTSDNNRQLIISLFMAGMTVSQLFYGPLSDQIGRKPAVAIGISIFLVGGVTCALSQSLTTMLVGRFLQGCGLAAMRILSVAIVRDKYDGAAMARIMSMAMSLFILVPCLAPLAGQLVLSFSHWRTIYLVLILAGIIIFLWFWLRQEETLTTEKRRMFTMRSFYQGLKEIVSHRITLGYTVASGVLSGAFTSYLLSSQQIFHDVFHSGEQFAFYFAVLAIGYGAASLVNAKLVMRFGMRRISYVSIVVMILLTSVLLTSALHLGPALSLREFIPLMMGVFVCISFMFGNMNAIALQPLGHMAGTASSVVSVLNGTLALIIGSSVGHAFNGTIIPFAGGATVCSICTLLIMLWSDQRGKSRDAQGESLSRAV